MKGRLSLYGSSTLLTILLFAQTPAADRIWSNATGGSFQDVANWTPADVPATTDRAVFDLNNDYVVTFAADAQTASASFISGVTTQNLSGATWTLNTDFRLGASAGKTNRTILAGGTLAVTNSSGTGLISVGEAGAGELTIRGARVFADRLEAKNGVRSNLKLEYGELTTTKGVTTQFPEGLILGRVADQMMTWNITGGSNAILNDGVYGYGALTLGSNFFPRSLSRAVLNLSGPATSLTVWGLDSYRSNVMTISNGALLNTHAVQWGLNSNGTNNILMISGDGSKWSNGYVMYFGMHAGSQTMVLTNGGVLMTGDSTDRDARFHAFSNPTNRFMITGPKSWLHSVGPAEFGLRWAVKKDPLDNLLLVTNGGKFSVDAECVIGSLIDAPPLSGPTISGCLFDIADGEFTAAQLKFQVGKIRFANGRGFFPSFKMDGGTNAFLDASGRMLVGSTAPPQNGDFLVGNANASVDGLNGYLRLGGMELGISAVDAGQVRMNGGSVVITNALIVGVAGSGSLRIEDGIITADEVKVAAQQGSAGTLTIVPPGKLETRSLFIGANGTVTINADAGWKVTGPSIINGTLNLGDATITFENEVTLGSTAQLKGTGSISFAGGLRLPANDIGVPFGLTVSAPNITSEGGKLLQLLEPAVGLTARVMDAGNLEIRLSLLGRNSFQIYLSTDLQNWSPASADTAQIVGDEVIWVVPTGSSQLFFRASVQ